MGLSYCTDHFYCCVFGSRLVDKKKAKYNNMNTLSGQTLLDVSVQETGTVESVFDIAEKNDLSLTDDIEAGYEMFIDQVIDNAVVIDYRSENRKPASGISTADINSVIGSGEGIGFMQIGYDFIVS